MWTNNPRLRVEGRAVTWTSQTDRATLFYQSPINSSHCVLSQTRTCPVTPRCNLYLSIYDRQWNVISVHCMSLAAKQLRYIIVIYFQLLQTFRNPLTLMCLSTFTASLTQAAEIYWLDIIIYCRQHKRTIIRLQWTELNPKHTRK